jgi:DNA-directed RNA polymerase subunit RPC12/RpoP
MPNRRPGSYGADDFLDCEKCGSKMLIFRRRPHPDFASSQDVELQTFGCVNCHHEISRAVNASGSDPHT